MQARRALRNNSLNTSSDNFSLWRINSNCSSTFYSFTCMIRRLKSGTQSRPHFHADMWINMTECKKSNRDSHSRSCCIDYSMSHTDSDVGDIPHNLQLTALWLHCRKERFLRHSEFLWMAIWRYDGLCELTRLVKIFDGCPWDLIILTFFTGSLWKS
jgi:hypothetical protein